MTITQFEIKELNNECCQDNCNEQATHYIFWPGQGKKRMCSEHALKAKRIADVMGFSLHNEVIDDSPRTDQTI